MEAFWTVPPDHPAFAGHFPGRPIVPGVVLVDRALLLAAGLLGGSVDRVRLAGAKFLSPVGPGETLHFLFEPRSGAFQFTVRAAGRDVASGSFSFPGGTAP